jgi:hypothetical protein
MQTRKINVGEAVALRLVNGLEYTTIAKLYGATKQGVEQAIKAYLKKIGHPAILETYKKNKTEFLTLAESVLLTDMLDQGKRDKASLNNTAFAFGTVHKANLLEQGKPTEVIDSRQAILAGIANLEKLEQEILRRGIKGD